MLQLQPSQNLTPLSNGDLLDLFPNLTTAKLAEMFQTFILEEKHIPSQAFLMNTSNILDFFPLNVCFTFETKCSNYRFHVL